jgi:hypothetical protein
MRKHSLSELIKIIAFMGILIAVIGPLYISYHHAKEKEIEEMYGLNESYGLLSPKLEIKLLRTDFSFTHQPHWHFIGEMQFYVDDFLYDDDAMVRDLFQSNGYVSCRTLTGKRLQTPIGRNNDCTCVFGQD